ncbi:PhzF family phenazine biosynthesis protein [Comamonas sp. BIGb0124]|uniref:PhzF family phenazine biosynthesis protein n=1 Tax=Comamonas sp. BIGb0124 TaxID=2485130 RepID=UPI000F486ACD|nr:PhzF family phenazine biosynthesis protein [Comamonas sp. BIGb0124]ROR20367.1 PhzF family phenazine biosynthesis protein [Comamonas sp. BIGb0124]
MSQQRLFKQVDVFTDRPYFGNALAVVLNGQDLDDEAMQRLARWTNLSETTFLLPPTHPQADYRVRIFTPGGELPFAGHPTLGSCHAWLEAGGQPRRPGRIVQECAVGLVELRHDQGRLSFAAPPLRRRPISATLLAQIAAALDIRSQHIEAAQILDNGPVWLGLLLADESAVLALQPDHEALRKLGHKVGVCAIKPDPFDSRLIARSSREARAFARPVPAVAPVDAAQANAPTLEVRAFAAPIGVHEDPVTGSLNASLAQWLIEDGVMPERYCAYQGQCLERDGQIFIERDADGQVWVGGHAVTCIDGHVTL